MNAENVSPQPRLPTSKTAGPALARLEEALAIFNDSYPEATLTTLLIFLLVAQGRGARSGALTGLSGMSQATVSRAVAALGKGTNKFPGPGLLNQVIDPLNTRAKVVRLTPKGAFVAGQIASALVYPSASIKGAAEAVNGADSSGPEMPVVPTPDVHWSTWF